MARTIYTTREAAYAAGATTYETGEPCKRGHVGPRQTTNGGCIACMRKKLNKPTGIQQVCELSAMVDVRLTPADMVVLNHYLYDCLQLFHKSRGLVLPMDPAKLAYAKEHGLRVESVPF